MLQAMRRATEHLEAMEAESQGPTRYGATAGEYTAEKLAELKKAQPFQLRTKSAPKAVKVSFTGVAAAGEWWLLV